jgi:hypothetical protein
MSKRTWDEKIRMRGKTILLGLVGFILHDEEDDGRSKAYVYKFEKQSDGQFIFVLHIPDDAERGRLVGPKCLHLSALQILFAAALRATFPTKERPEVVVGIRDPYRNRVLKPQGLAPESELEPEPDEEIREWEA